MMFLKWYSTFIMSLAMIINGINILDNKNKKDKGANIGAFLITLPIVIYLIWG